MPLDEVTRGERNAIHDTEVGEMRWATDALRPTQAPRRRRAVVARWVHVPTLLVCACTSSHPGVALDVSAHSPLPVCGESYMALRFAREGRPSEVACLPLAGGLIVQYMRADSCSPASTQATAIYGRLLVALRASGAVMEASGGFTATVDISGTTGCSLDAARCDWDSRSYACRFDVATMGRVGDNAEARLRERCDLGPVDSGASGTHIVLDALVVHGRLRAETFEPQGDGGTWSRRCP